jgi:hypothetical protein
MAELASNVVTAAKDAEIRHIVRLSAKGADVKAELPVYACIVRLRK